MSYAHLTPHRTAQEEAATAASAEFEGLYQRLLAVDGKFTMQFAVDKARVLHRDKGRKGPGLSRLRRFVEAEEQLKKARAH